MNKTAIKNFAVWARQKLISDITYKAGMLGITENGIAEKLPQSTSDLLFFDIGTKNYSEVSGKEIKQREALVSVIHERERSFKSFKEAFENTVEEVAYTWFNRLIAIRFMEVNEYLPSGIRVLSSENNAKNEPDFVTTPFDTDLEFTPVEQDKVIMLKDENKLDELFRMLFIKQCNKLNDILPELFEKTDDYTELLLNISFTDKDGVVYRLVHDIDEDDFNVEKEGQVEIIGWMYQYYNTKLNELVYDGTMSKSKIPKELIPAATTIYTPDWPIRYMVENSLGCLWYEAHKNDKLKDMWKYYIDEAKQDANTLAELEKYTEQYKKINPNEIKIIDPCMGSGHILVYAFEVLMQIYESCGYTQREASKSILLNNIYGLDIDKRAYQLSYFALMMKARQYNRRILKENISPNLFYIRDNSALTADVIEYIAKNDEKIEADLKSISNDLNNATEYGSLISVTSVDFDAIYQSIEETQYGELDILSLQIPEKIMPIIRQAEVLSQKYDVVVTNPPYLGSSRFSPQLYEYVKKNYQYEKSDLSMAMYKRSLYGFSKNGGMVAFITTSSWMFLSSFEKMRNNLYQKASIYNLVDYGTELFDGKVGHNPIVSWVARNVKTDYLLAAIRLVDYCYSHREEKEPEFFESKNRYTAKQENFSKIPGSPVAYWVSENFIKAFEKGTLLGKIADSKQGLATGCNDIFVRLWFECKIQNISFDCDSCEQSISLNKKWFPYNKGGDYRKWYGNNDYVVNWENDGILIRNFKNEKGKLRSRPQNTNYYFKKCFSWSLISSSVAAFRFKPSGHIFDVAGMSCFSEKNLYYLLALCNTKVVMEVLKVIAPTINYQCGDIANIPVIFDESKRTNIETMVDENISLCKTDWDAFETSWDFKRSPLV